MSAKISSSEIRLEPRPIKRPSSDSITSAVRPPGMMVIPPPYAETSTVEPGVRPRESRRALGSRIRPPESIVASMGTGYHLVPMLRWAKILSECIHPPLGMHSGDSDMCSLRCGLGTSFRSAYPKAGVFNKTFDFVLRVSRRRGDSVIEKRAGRRKKATINEYSSRNEDLRDSL